MPSLSFVLCTCGIELKVMKLLNDHRQSYACACGNDVAIVGTILEAFWRKGSQFDKDPGTSVYSNDWVKVDSWRIRDSP